MKEKGLSGTGGLAGRRRESQPFQEGKGGKKMNHHGRDIEKLQQE